MRFNRDSLYLRLCTPEYDKEWFDMLITHIEQHFTISETIVGLLTVIFMPRHMLTADEIKDFLI